MEREPGYIDELQRDFEASLVHELLPGILHNFANPLNGIMGRSKLLQKRAGQAFGSNARTDTPPSVTDKIIRDIDLISEQGDRLYELFLHVAAKVRNLHDRKRGPLNLSELLSEEIAFLDFYLDFKHSIEKNINLNMNVPAVMGLPAHYSLALSSIIRHAITSMGDCEVRVLSVYSDCEDCYVKITISYSGEHDKSLSALMPGNGTALAGSINGKQGLFNALSLLKQYGVMVSSDTSAGVNKINLSVPCGE